MGAKKSTPKATPAPEVEINRDTNIDNSEWHILEFHMPTMIAGGAALLAVGLCFCCGTKLLRYLQLYAHRQEAARRALFDRVQLRARTLAMIESGKDDEDPSSPKTTPNGFSFK